MPLRPPAFSTKGYICTNTIVESVGSITKPPHIYLSSPPAPDFKPKPSRPTAAMRVVPAFWGCNPAPIFPHYRMGLIICGFPGIGKTELADQPLLVPHYRITELDSSEFLSRHVNAGTVAAYCTALINACEPNTIVLASTHHEVLQELWDRRSHLVFIYPLESEKDEWIARLQSRQASADLVNLVRNNWDALMYDFERYTHLAYTLRSDQDLREEIKRIVTDILNRLEVMVRQIEAARGLPTT